MTYLTHDESHTAKMTQKTRPDKKDKRGAINNDEEASKQCDDKQEELVATRTKKNQTTKCLVCSSAVDANI